MLPRGAQSDMGDPPADEDEEAESARARSEGESESDEDLFDHHLLWPPLTLAVRGVLAAYYLPRRTAQESRLLDLLVEMSDEADDLVRHLHDWRRVAREQAAASEVALSSKASERQQLLKSIYRIEARLLAMIESPVEIAGAPPHPWRVGGSTERGAMDPGGCGQSCGQSCGHMARGLEQATGCGGGCGTEQSILAAASTAISPSLRLGVESGKGNGPLVHLASPVRSLSRSISGSLSGSLSSVNSARDREAMRGFEAAAAAAATAASGGARLCRSLPTTHSVSPTTDYYLLLLTTTYYYLLRITYYLLLLTTYSVPPTTYY